jgi:hypothetical protein
MVLGPPLLAVLASAVPEPASHRIASRRELAARRTWSRAERLDHERRPLRQHVHGCRLPGPAAWLGSHAFGLDARPAQGVCRRSGPSDLPATYRSVFYERCRSRSDPRTCSMDLELQTWPACERFPRRFIRGPGGLPVPYLRATAAGRLVALYDAGRRADVLAGPVSIAIFSDVPGLALRAAGRLTARAAGAKLSTSVLPGALSGRLRCAYGA